MDPVADPGGPKNIQILRSRILNTDIMFTSISEKISRIFFNIKICFCWCTAAIMHSECGELHTTPQMLCNSGGEGDVENKKTKKREV
jgi:hypothetical protein